MPNYIRNKIVLNGTIDQIEECVKKHTKTYPAEIDKAWDGGFICETKEGKIGWLYPETGLFKRRNEPDVDGMPKEYEVRIKQEVKAFPDFSTIVTPPNDPAYRDEPSQDVARNSPNWWYNWNTRNWGTKWNIMEPGSEKFGSYHFDTAWSGVPQMIQKLSELNPDLEINYIFADEDTGHNVGCYKFKAGELLEIFTPDGGTKEAYDIAFLCRPHYKEDYELIDGNYQYKDEE